MVFCFGFKTVNIKYRYRISGIICNLAIVLAESYIFGRIPIINQMAECI